MPERVPTFLRAQDYPWCACSKGLRRSLLVVTRVSIVTFVASPVRVHSLTNTRWVARLMEPHLSIISSQWIDFIWIGANKTLLQYCKNSCDVLLYIRAIPGHTGGDVIASELMGHVAVPLRWEEFLHHRGSSFELDINSSSRTHRKRKGQGKKGDKQYSSHLQTRGETRQKKNSTMMYRGREKCTTTVNGSLIRTPSAVSTLPGHKTRDFGRQSLTP